MSANELANKRPLIQTKLQGFVLLLTLALLYFPLFLRLDTRPLREWDEARNAVNAYEMSKTGQFLVKTYDYEPDLWETKPPFLEWLQIIGFKTIGYNELAVRLPSALASFVMLVFIILWLRKHTQDFQVGILAALIVVCSNGFIHEHGSRTGDHDALMIAFTIGFLLNVFQYLEFKQNKALMWASLCLSAAVLTKSVAALMVLPGVLLYVLVQKQLLACLKNKAFWQALGLFLLIILGYYGTREMMAPGYLTAVWDNEFLPRYLNQSDRFTYTVSEWDFYWKQLKTWQFAYWLPLLLPSFILSLAYYKGFYKRLVQMLACVIVLFYLAIAKGSSNVWYDLPLIPLMALIIAMGLNVVYETIIKSQWKRMTQIIALLILTVSLFYVPYSEIIAKVMDTHETSAQVMYPEALKRLEKQFPNNKNICLFEPLGSNYPLAFYKHVWTDTKGYHFQNSHRNDPFLSGQSVLILKDQWADFEALKLPCTILISSEFYKWMLIK